MCSYLYPSLKGYFAQNADNFKNVAKFKVKNGECNDSIEFYAANADVETATIGITGNDALRIQEFLLGLIDSFD